MKQEMTAVGDSLVAVNVPKKETAFPRRRAMDIGQAPEQKYCLSAVLGDYYYNYVYKTHRDRHLM